MPLMGEYQPNSNPRDRKQVEQYEATNGAEGGTLKGKPVIVLTYKVPNPVRFEDALAGSSTRVLTPWSLPTAARPPTLSGTATSSPIRWSNCRMAQSGKSCGPAKSQAMRRTNGGSVQMPPGRIFLSTAPAQAVKFRCSFWSRSRLRDLKSWVIIERMPVLQMQGNLVRRN